MIKYLLFLMMSINMYKRKLLISIIIILINLIIPIYSKCLVQSVKKPISKDKPVLFIKFEKVGKRKPIYKEESENGIWLRLYNNSEWAINIPTEDFYSSIPFEKYKI